MILLVGSLALMKAAHAVLASSETNGWYSYGLQAVHPVEVTLVGLERESAYQALVSRVSPRGNTEPMNHRFSGGGNTWFLQNDYLSTVRVHLPPAYVGKLDFVRIEVGTRSHGVEGPHGAGEWQPLSTPDERGRTVYEYVVPPDQLPFTVVPVFKSVLNYVGDIHLALWTLLWAALAVVPPFLVHLLQRARPHVAQALKDWFICGSVRSEERRCRERV